jgi:hypothetical protein
MVSFERAGIATIYHRCVALFFGFLNIRQDINYRRQCIVPVKLVLSVPEVSVKVFVVPLTSGQGSLRATLRVINTAHERLALCGFLFLKTIFTIQDAYSNFIIAGRKT